MKEAKQWVALAFAGLAAGAAGCGSGTQAAESPAAEPTSEKHGCKTDAEGKHVCGSEMKPGTNDATPAPSSGSSTPAGQEPHH